MTLPARFKVLGTSAILSLLVACTGQSTLAPLNQGPAAPRNVKGVTEAVDGLIVGHRLMYAGEYELALKAYNRAASTHGLNVDVLSAIGSANLRLGRLNQAEKILRLAVEKDKDFVPAWNNLGVTLNYKGEYGEAALVFRTAFALDSGNSAEIHANLTRALEKLKNPGYVLEKQEEFELVRRGNGRYLLLSTPDPI